MTCCTSIHEEMNPRSADRRNNILRCQNGSRDSNPHHRNQQQRALRRTLVTLGLEAIPRTNWGSWQKTQLLRRVSEETNPSTAIAPVLTAFVFDASTTTLHQTLAPNLIQRWRLSPSSDEKDRGPENQKSFIVESRLHLVTPYGVIINARLNYSTWTRATY